MAITIQLQSRYAKSEEERARNMRRTYGQNTIVWFLRGHNRAVYGIDAEVMESLFNLTPEFDPSTGKTVIYWNRQRDDTLYPRLVAKGYKIVCLNN